MRLVSLCPSNTEILAALGVADQIVGLDRSSDFPAEITHLPRVGADIEIDVGAVVALRPDLVFSSLSVPGMERNIAALDAAGVPHVVVDAQDLAGVYASIRLVGRALGLGGPAETVVTEMCARLEVLRACAPAKRPRVFLEWWPRPVIVPGARCWTTEMIRIAGGEPAFAHLDVRSTPVEEADVIAAAPDVLLTCWCGVPHDRQRTDRLYTRPGWDTIPGVRAGRVWAAEERFFGRPGPRIVEGVEWLAERLASAF